MKNNFLFYKNHLEDMQIRTVCCNQNGKDYTELVLKLFLKWKSMNSSDLPDTFLKKTLLYIVNTV